VQLLAPAKVNLGLRIVGRRSDGYHELESLFAPLDLADRLEVTLEEGAPAEVRLVLAGESGGVPTDARNLAARAAQAFLDAAGRRARVRIALEKRVPAAAGLGGGSSDAGAVLRALDRRLPGALRPEALAELALGLGADVPFFLDPRPALVSGVGERRGPLPRPLPSLALLLAIPGVPLATAAVFAAHAKSGAAPRARGGLVAALDEALAGPDGSLPERLGALLANDLEAAAELACPGIAAVRRALRECGARAVGLSGSGATLYGVFAGPAEAEAGLRRTRLPAGGWARLARTLEAG
jgi:4-diphosphocytidyl-2-C-methyl-D-erythritol kinase